MNVLLLFCALFSRFVPFPNELVLVGGQKIAIEGAYRVMGRTLGFRHRPDNAFFLLPIAKIDFRKTHAPRPTEARIQPPRDLRRVPWDHPAFKDKTASLNEVAITGETLSSFLKRFKVGAYPEPDDGE